MLAREHNLHTKHAFMHTHTHLLSYLCSQCEQELVLAREHELAQRLMEEFGIEMDGALLEAQRSAASLHSRPGSPDVGRCGKQ